MNIEKNLNVRRLVGAILLAIAGLLCFIESQNVSGLAMFGIIRDYQTFLYFFGAWGVGLAIWYFVSLKKPTSKKAELIVKIIFYIAIIANCIFAAMDNVDNATLFGILLIIAYSIGCPWGKKGYKKHPYVTATETVKN
ncbi:hypothetical protein [Lactobacillus hominis]|uniref:hypothetical protein n=1 Tax=Lactobacillus hominis TaxID=1203033 RepID=UPI0023F35E51|nr:hypothetical protein [Lactobacillus hominis]